jgi:hypothetical protein
MSKFVVRTIHNLKYIGSGQKLTELVCYLKEIKAF